MNKCECGCGQECNKRFVNGHNIRLGKCNRTGSIFSKEQKNLISQKLKDIKKSDNHKNNMKKSFTDDRRKKYAEFLKINNPMFNEEVRKKVSLKQKGRQVKESTKIKLMKYCGPLNSRWKGGISDEGYCDLWKDKEYKKEIKKRDFNTCLNPECSKKCNKIVIHHINYDKKDCNPLNLITICSSCNSKANSDREWHKAWYNAILYRRTYNEQKTI
jgi:hypothetical protein